MKGYLPAAVMMNSATRGPHIVILVKIFRAISPKIAKDIAVWEKRPMD
jgi:hypothetical protein